MRRFKSFSNYKQNADTTDKILSALSCLTTGLVGFIWLIVSHIRGVSLSSFAKPSLFKAFSVILAPTADCSSSPPLPIS